MHNPRREDTGRAQQGRHVRHTLALLSLQPAGALCSHRPSARSQGLHSRIGTRAPCCREVKHRAPGWGQRQSLQQQTGGNGSTHPLLHLGQINSSHSAISGCKTLGVISCGSINGLRHSVHSERGLRSPSDPQQRGTDPGSRPENLAAPLHPQLQGAFPRQGSGEYPMGITAAAGPASAHASLCYISILVSLQGADLPGLPFDGTRRERALLWLRPLPHITCIM